MVYNKWLGFISDNISAIKHLWPNTLRPWSELKLSHCWIVLCCFIQRLEKVGFISPTSNFIFSEKQVLHLHFIMCLLKVVFFCVVLECQIQSVRFNYMKRLSKRFSVCALLTTVYNCNWQMVFHIAWKYSSTLSVCQAKLQQLAHTAFLVPD